jgi:hypothetical protein
MNIIRVFGDKKVGVIFNAFFLGGKKKLFRPSQKKMIFAC